MIMLLFAGVLKLNVLTKINVLNILFFLLLVLFYKLPSICAFDVGLCYWICSLFTIRSFIKNLCVRVDNFVSLRMKFCTEIVLSILREAPLTFLPYFCAAYLRLSRASQGISIRKYITSAGFCFYVFLLFD